MTRSERHNGGSASSNEDRIVQSIEWHGDHLRLLDQTRLPERSVYVDIDDIGRVWEAINRMRVRGAPAIGIAAAYGLYLGIRNLPESGYESFRVEVDRLAGYLASARPTAVNLQWALDRLRQTIHAHRDQSIPAIKERVFRAARTIHEEDKRVCRRIGEHGLEVVGRRSRILTHCHTGSLATGKFGTALSVVYHAHWDGHDIHVWVDETRPQLQGARITAWELQQAGIPMKLIVDSTAGYLMKLGKVDLIITGTDRVAANGDTANKIGTYMLAVLAAHHGIPFYVAAPLSSVDMNTPSGNDIPVEERDASEVLGFGDKQTAPPKTGVFNPSFDVTPANLITGFITEEGIIRPDFREGFQNAFTRRDAAAAAE